jgi:hypothetical protein
LLYFQQDEKKKEPEPFSKFRVPKNSFGTLFKNLGSKKPVLEPFLKFRIPKNPFWNPFFVISNLGFRPEHFPGTLQNLDFIRVPEPVLVSVRPEPFLKFRVLKGSRTGSSPWKKH